MFSANWSRMAWRIVLMLAVSSSVGIRAARASSSALYPASSTWRAACGVSIAFLIATSEVIMGAPNLSVRRIAPVAAAPALSRPNASPMALRWATAAIQRGSDISSSMAFDTAPAAEESRLLPATDACPAISPKRLRMFCA